MVGILSIMRRIFAKLRKPGYAVRPGKHENDKNVMRFLLICYKLLICNELSKIQNCCPYYKNVLYTKIHEKTTPKNRTLAWNLYMPHIPGRFRVNKYGPPIKTRLNAAGGVFPCGHAETRAAALKLPLSVLKHVFRLSCNYPADNMGFDAFQGLTIEHARACVWAGERAGARACVWAGERAGERAGACLRPAIRKVSDDFLDDVSDDF